MKLAYILFDGECSFCNTWICFIKSKLKNKDVSFIPLKSSQAINILKNYDAINQDSVIYIKNNKVYLKSQAVLKICKQLQFPYNLLHFFKIIPKFMLDFAYDFIAARRLKLTSKKQCCNG